MAENAAYLLTALMERKQGIIRTLVLGPGAGLELADIDSIAAARNHPVEIDTLGLTALPPRFLLNKDSREISAILIEHIQDHRRDLSALNGFYDVLFGAAQGQNRGVERAEFIQSIKQVGTAAYSLERAPGTPEHRLLNICRYLRAVHQPAVYCQLERQRDPRDDPAQTHDLILDNHGGFFYTVLQEGLKEAVLAVEPLLDKNGVFYADHIPWMEGEADNMEFDNVMVFVKAGNPCSLAIIRKNSVVYGSGDGIGPER